MFVCTGGNAMADEGKEVALGKTPESRQRILDWIDASAKLLGAVAIIFVALAANGFQDKMNRLNLQNQDRMTGLTLQSQREQAESQLRAAMFSSLIQPFVGAEKGSPIPVDREELLAQLLVLNFNEDFESKPLMERVDARLAVEPVPKWQIVSTAEGPREALRAIARRVADRQISSLSWDWKNTTSSEQHGCEVYWLNLTSQPATAKAPAMPGSCTLALGLGELISIASPDAKSKLEMVAHNLDATNQTVSVSVQAQVVGEDERHEAPIAYRFTLTWFDLPLTDNTILPNGARFAVNLRAFYDPKTVALRVIWFPPGYFTVRERPLDSRRILNLLAPPDEKY
jgi:hypothetical protein